MNALAMNWRHWLAVVLLIIAAATGLNYRWEPPAALPDPSQIATEAAPDLRVTQPVLEVFDSNGRRQRQLAGTELRQFDQTHPNQPGYSTLSSPRLHFLQQRDPSAAAVPWQLQADQAVLRQDGELIDLAGSVALWSDATAGGRTEIRSETLHLDTRRQYAETDKAVTIRARRSEATAPGLKADLANERLILSPGAHPSSRVKETHEVRR